MRHYDKVKFKITFARMILMNLLMRFLVKNLKTGAVLILLLCVYPGKSQDNISHAASGTSVENKMNPDTTVSLVYHDTLIVQSYSKFDLPVNMKVGSKISAISLGLFFPDNYLDITGMELTGVAQGYYFNVKDSLFFMAWSNITPIEITENSPVITLHLKSLDLTGLTSTLKLELDVASEFADESANVIDGVILEVPEILWPAPDPEDTLSGRYIKVYPNPFKENTIVEFYLESDSHVKITLCNVAGESLSPVTDASYAKGFHQVPVSAVNFSKGICLLKFEADDGVKGWKELIKVFPIR
jgi:hypothetical protein